MVNFLKILSKELNLYSSNKYPPFNPQQVIDGDSPLVLLLSDFCAGHIRLDQTGNHALKFFGT